VAKKPKTAEGYAPESLDAVRSMCLYMATKLGDLVDNDIVLVGGLVPSLLIDQEGTERHAGTSTWAWRSRSSMRSAIANSPRACATRGSSPTPTRKGRPLANAGASAQSPWIS